MTPAARQRRRVRVPVLVVTALAWVGLAASARGAVAGHQMTADVTGRRMLVPLGLMVVAMMAPLTIPLLGGAVERSVPRRRRRTAALVTLGGAAVWAWGAVVLMLVATAVRSHAALVVAFLVALVWQCSPTRQRCRNRMHAHPALSPFGRAADRDAWRAGVEHARWCTGSCWAVMLAAMLVEPA